MTKNDIKWLHPEEYTINENIDNIDNLDIDELYSKSSELLIALAETINEFPLEKRSSFKF